MLGNLAYVKKLNNGNSFALKFAIVPMLHSFWTWTM